MSSGHFLLTFNRSQYKFLRILRQENLEKLGTSQSLGVELGQYAGPQTKPMKVSKRKKQRHIQTDFNRI